MRTIISGDITIIEPTEEVMAWVEENMVFKNPVYKNLMRMDKMETIKRRHVAEEIKAYTRRANSIIVPFGCLYGLWPMIRNGEWSTDFPEYEKSFIDMPCAVDLFDYQSKAVDEMVKAKGGVLQSPCGSGKTYIGIEILRRIGLRFLWICGKKDLLNQTYNNLRKLYPDLDIGLTTDGQVEFGKDGTISTVQTLINVDYRLYQNEFGVVMVDECHHLNSDPQTRQMYARVMGRCKARYKYGLTATPKRQDGLQNMLYINAGMRPDGKFKPTYVVPESKTQSLVAKYETFRIDTPTSYSYLMEDGSVDYNALLEYLGNNANRTERICEYIKELIAEGRKLAVLSYRVDHVYKIQEKLLEMDVRCETITGRTTDKSRKGALGNTDGWDAIISTVHLFKEGLDIPSLDTLMVVLPFKDEIGIQQSEGRIERPYEGKKEPLFIYAFDVNLPYCQTVERKMRRIVGRRRK